MNVAVQIKFPFTLMTGVDELVVPFKIKSQLRIAAESVKPFIGNVVPVAPAITFNVPPMFV